MKLSDISTLALSPGRYTIVAAYDGDDSFNPVQAQYILTVNAVTRALTRGRSVTDDNEDGQKPELTKRDPEFYFSPSTVSFNEAETGKYSFDYTGYLVNNDRVAYSISLSEGLYLETDGSISWYDSGSYTITLTTLSTDVFNSKVITMTLDVTSKTNPQIEYNNNDGTFVLQDGVLVKKYYNLEKRDGVYKFDLVQPSNPYSLPLEYKIEGVGNCYIDVDNNKVYVSREGRYKITATFAGDATYRPSVTSYILSYYENAENEANDNQGTYVVKQSPNLSFSSNTINATLNQNGTYTGQQVNNPFGVDGIWATSNNANITADGSTITLNGTGNVIVYYSFYGDDNYSAQSVSYVLHVYVQENPDGKPIPNISFENNSVTVTENEQHEYHIQQVNNPDAVNVNYYCNGEQIYDGVLKTDYVGAFTIIAETEEDDTFYKASATYTLTITAYEQSRPQIWFLTDNETTNETADHTYLIQLANCNVDVPITYKVSSGTLNDRVLTYDGIGTVVITATTQETFYYQSVSASYVLNILEVNKLSPGIYFKYKKQYGKAYTDYVNQSQSNTYDILPLYNPHNVAVRFYTDRGTVDNETNATKLYMSEEDNKTGIVNIYAQSIEDETYKSEIATYKLKISETISLDIDYSGDIGSYGYSSTLYIDAKGKLNAPVVVELLRFPKDPNFNFVANEWYLTPFSSFYTVNNLIYSEDGNESVISASITFSRYSTHYLKFKFKGNEKFNETPEINVQISYSNSQQSPEISFPSNIEIITQPEDYNYVLQDVENPHNVDIVYSASQGTVTGNILHFEDIYNLVIYATSVETDEYYSQTIRYTLKINKREKPSRGWHFAAGDDTPIPVHQNGKYVVRDIVDENDDLVPIENLTGQFSCSMTSTFEYDDEQDKYIVTLTNQRFLFDYNNGVDYFTINYKLPETTRYKAETLTYRQYVEDKPRANISFNEATVNLKQVEDGKYAIQAINNPDNHPIIWTIEGAGQYDDANDPKYILIPDTSTTWTKITATVAETDTVKRTSAQYSLYILKVTQHLSDWTVKWKDEYSTDPSDPNELYGRVNANETGVYDLWNMIDIIGGTWEDVDIEISGSNCSISENRYLIVTSNPLQNVEVRIWAKETFETLRSLFRLWLLVKYPQQRTLFDRMSYSGELTGSVNEEFDIEFGRWPYQPDFVFKEEEWSYTDQGWGTIKNIYTKTVNEYTVLCGTFSTSKLNAYNNGRITFKGNETFYSNYITYEIYVNKQQEPQDTRITPALSFNNYNVKTSKTSNDQYLLQTLNKPDDCEIDRWEIVDSSYGTPTIIDDTYVHFPIDDTSRWVNIKVYTKDSDIYKASSIAYTLQVSPIAKSDPQIRFRYTSKTSNKNDNHTYELPQLENPYSLPVTWSTTLGTIENGYLVYDGVGTATLTVTFDGDDTYEATTTKCTYRINNQYDKQYITYKKYGDREVQVIFGEEYSFEVLRWPVSIGLEFNAADWRYSTSSFTCSILGLESEDDGEYRILKAKYIFNKAGSAYVTVNFNGNDYFYSQSHIADYTIYYTRAANLSNPNISFAESTMTMPYNDTHKYLIQTPTGAAGVTFNAPTTSLGTIEKVGDYYYIVYDGEDGANITISIKNVQDSTYYQQTISYTLNVEAKPIEVQDTQISFANIEETKNYVWEANKTKRYKIQDLYNPWGLNVEYSISAGNLRQESDGYYIYYDTIGDITINVVGQSNQYYNGSTASYTMHIVSVGEDFVMEFAQSTMTVTQTPEGRYLLQQVTLNPDVSDIRDNIVYSAVGATIEAAGDDFYIVYNGIGNLRVKALFESDNHYKSKEAYYTLTIEEDIQMVDPDISISTNNIRIEDITTQTRFKVPNVTNNSGVDYAWYIGNTQLVVDTNGYFNYNAADDFVVTLKTVTTRYFNSIKLYCNYINVVDPDISISNNIKVENITTQTRFKVPTVTNNSGVEYSWYIGDTQLAVDANGYFNYNATGDFVVTLKTVATQRYKSINLYCSYTDFINPDISISTNNIEILNISSQTRFKVPTVTNNSGVEYAWYIGNTKLVVDANGYFNYNATGDFVVTLKTVETQRYKSIRFNCNYTNIGYEDVYFTIESLEDNNEMIWKINEEQANAYTPTTIHYSTDLENWTSIVSSLEGTYICTLDAGEKVYFKGPLTYRYTIFPDGSVNSYDYRNNQFVSNGNFNVSGNIMSLVYGDDFRNKHEFDGAYSVSPGCSLYALFRNSHVISAEHLILPATTLPETHSNNPYYSYMFYDCTNLITPPELPATTLADSCYAEMFSGCTSLVNAPELPATTLAYDCYRGMFSGCTSLVNAPELPATTLADSCYYDMFGYCRSLTSVRILAEDISAYNCLYEWLEDVPLTGTFTKKSGVEYPTGSSGIPQRWTIVNI